MRFVSRKLALAFHQLAEALADEFPGDHALMMAGHGRWIGSITHGVVSVKPEGRAFWLRNAEGKHWNMGEWVDGDGQDFPTAQDAQRAGQGVVIVVTC